MVGSYIPPSTSRSAFTTRLCNPRLSHPLGCCGVCRDHVRQWGNSSPPLRPRHALLAFGLVALRPLACDLRPAGGVGRHQAEAESTFRYWQATRSAGRYQIGQQINQPPRHQPGCRVAPSIVKTPGFGFGITDLRAVSCPKASVHGSPPRSDARPPCAGQSRIGALGGRGVIHKRPCVGRS